jgi:hypothetical protein
MGVLMSRRALAVLLVLPLLVTATVLALPDGQPDIQGDWDAKVNIKGFSTETDGGKEKFKIAVPIRFSQNGSQLTMTVFPPGDPSFEMEGEIGNGHFWVVGETEGGRPRMAVGHISKNEKKIKAVFLEAWDDEVAEIKIAAKRQKK